ncbi:MAG: Stf0 family sulfotransferase [Lamprobacter sp.]|uniref:Stf0 family sulfotransferase n=1 Tax=Lamprobacter sp. TaxID=3100796 RepID=UPI002B2567F5|nr:Stf0 family sulfotransferase [Lamprobacter sp.]MEA3642698.1 Stf0 family sulfotransferase [Lamprobacter sp.]
MKPSTPAMPAAPLWPQALSRYPFAAALLPGWRDATAELPEAYSAALDAALAAFDPERPLSERYQQLRASRARLAELAAAGDQHIATQLLRLRVLSAFGEPQAARQLSRALLAQREHAAQATPSPSERSTQPTSHHPQDQAAALRKRPFLPSCARFDACPPPAGDGAEGDTDDLAAWLNAQLLETDIQLNAERRHAHPQAELARLAQRRKLPEAGIESERMLALAALRSGKKITIKPGSRLLQEGSNLLIWEHIGGMVDTQVDATTRTLTSKIETASSVRGLSDIPPPPEPIPENDHVHGEPVVTVLCLTYNHVNFIEDAIKGIVGQKTSFPFDVLIHDDASNDGTQAIIERYAALYPRIIKPVYQKENQYSKNINPTRLMLPLVKGKYTAICDGDDYWVDPNKLQKQYSFMRRNPGYSCCYHDAFIFNEKGMVKKSKLPEQHKKDFSKKELLLNQCFVLTISLFYRTACNDNPPELDQVKNGDNLFLSMLGLHGKGKYLAGVTPAAYRIHGNSVWSSRTARQKQDMIAITFEGIARYHERQGNQEAAVYYRHPSKTTTEKRSVYLQIGSFKEPSKDSISQAMFDFERTEQTPKLICIIASTPRCGSTFLGQVLQSQGYAVPHEYLNTVHIPYLAHRWGLIRDKKVELNEYLRACFRWRTNPQGIFSLKAHWSQFQPFLEKGIIVPWLKNSRFIYIRRKDLLGQAISYEIASQTGKWGSMERQSREPVYDGQSIERRLKNLAQQNMAWSVFFAKNNIKWVEVNYESFIEETEKSLACIKKEITPEFELEKCEEKKGSSEMKIQRNAVNDKWRELFLNKV